MGESIQTIFKNFVNKENTYFLVKLASTEKSNVPEGYGQMGFVNILNLPQDESKIMVYINGTQGVLKTSPVVEILEKNSEFLEFKTESGSWYKLSKY